MLLVVVRCYGVLIGFQRISMQLLGHYQVVATGPNQQSPSFGLERGLCRPSPREGIGGQCPPKMTQPLFAQSFRKLINESKKHYFHGFGYSLIPCRNAFSSIQLTGTLISTTVTLTHFLQKFNQSVCKAGQGLLSSGHGLEIA